ncbi:MAG: septal ring lytic transglycosylase RlpA family protein [Rhizobiaceae bacterium]|nr:septal ring lytic transglycosylase RlpA family protein [Rhizobiaceae bacterium]
MTIINGLSGNIRILPRGITPKLALVASLIILASCASPKKIKHTEVAHINNKTKFSSLTYGVKSSPRVTTSKKVRKGGGRSQIGKPYKIRGKWYYPKDQPGYNKVGVASWYGPNFHGRLTANGEIYDQYALSAAHPTLPLPSYAKVTSMETGSSVIVRINDRGPFSSKRIIDLSYQASKLLGFQKKGLAKVRVQYIGKARMDGLDAKYLMASYKPARGQRYNPTLPTFAPGATRPGTLIAGVQKPVPQSQIAQPAPQLAAPQLAAPQPVQTAYAAPATAPGFQLENAPLLTGGFIPVPILRPTQLYDGLKMNLASDNNLVISVLPPLSYLQSNQYNQRIARAFDAIKSNVDK